MDFIAIDVETANADMSSICALGLVHFKNGHVFRNLSTLIDPEDEFDATNIAVHGIRPEDVVGKPTMRMAYPIIEKNLANCILVHHSPFDRTAFKRVAQKNGFTEMGCAWLDSLRVARRAWHGLATYGLASLAHQFQIAFRHHDAAEDARCAGLLMLRAIADTGIPIENWFDLVDAPIFPPKVIAQKGDPEGYLYGEVIVFTGELSIGRSDAADLAAKVGCEVCASVTKRTTILVVGEQDVRLLHGATRSSKHRKAETLIGEGQPIRIISEPDFRLLAEAPRRSLRREFGEPVWPQVAAG